MTFHHSPEIPVEAKRISSKMRICGDPPPSIPVGAVKFNWKAGFILKSKVFFYNAY